jgi:hypothetical protein
VFTFSNRGASRILTVTNLQAYALITGEEMEEIKRMKYQEVRIYTHFSLQLCSFDAKFGKRISSCNSL